jgi:hypothetical protein
MGWVGFRNKGFINAYPGSERNEYMLVMVENSFGILRMIFKELSLNTNLHFKKNLML